MLFARAGGKMPLMVLFGENHTELEGVSKTSRFMLKNISATSPECRKHPCLKNNCLGLCARQIACASLSTWPSELKKERPRRAAHGIDAVSHVNTSIHSGGVVVGLCEHLPHEHTRDTSTRPSPQQCAPKHNQRGITKGRGRSAFEEDSLGTSSWCEAGFTSELPTSAAAFQMKDWEHDADGKQEALMGTDTEWMGVDSARKEEQAKHQSVCPRQRQRRKPRKPPSNPVGWSEGKSTAYDIAQRPNRIVVINGEQVRRAEEQLALDT